MYPRLHALIDQITALPNVQLTKIQQDYFNKIFKGIYRDADSYLDHLSHLKNYDKNILTPTIISELKNYLKKISTVLPPILAEAKNIYEELSIGWNNATHHDLLSADELIPLFIYCLSDDLLDLIKITNRLFLPCQLNHYDEEGYVLIVIYTASQNKAASIQKKEMILSQDDKNKYKNVLLESIMQANIKKLKDTCKLYINYLLPFILHQIKKEPLMKYYCDPKKKFIKSVEELTEDFHTQTSREIFGSSANNKTLILLLDKIKILFAIKQTIKANLTSFETLEAYREIFNHHEQTLMHEGYYAYNTFLDNSASLFGAKHYYRLQNWEHHEGRYLKNFNDVVKDFMSLEGKESNECFPVPTL